MLAIRRELPVIYTDRSRIRHKPIILTGRDIERFYSKVVKSPDEDSCWDWDGNTDKKGYPEFRICHASKPGKYRANRVSFFIHYNEDPGHKLVCHTCDNPSCVNPKHLFLGTHKDNYTDMATKNRNIKGDKHWARLHPEKVRRGADCNLVEIAKKRRGELNNKAKLTESDVKLMRYMYGEGLADQRELARRFNIRQASVWAVVNKITWKHI
jgi:hypothetical protein